ncbi:MAG: ABC transporter ATP-binding protein [Candidatus Atribacteria bacterium]|nr:ABC transporter ATP-binding protein [Candidatus Atribacteria bacterium]
MSKLLKTEKEETVYIEIEDLKAYYTTEQYGIVKEIKAVENISINIEGNSFLAIVGESGCGKTTLARVLYGAVDSPLSIIEGKICYHFNDKKFELSPTSNSLKKIWWEKLSYIPQGSLSALNPIRRLKDIFSDLALSHGKAYDEQKVKTHLEMVNLPSYVLQTYPFELSGGMRQRCVIALATFLNPNIIIADEPTSALDVVTQRDILQLLNNIQTNFKSTFIFITHDISLVPGLADMMAIMYGGCIVEFGSTESIFVNPLHPYTKFLLSSIPKIGDKTEKKPIPGNPVNLINPPVGCRFSPRCPLGKEICTESRPNLFNIDTQQHQVACWLYQ